MTTSNVSTFIFRIARVEGVKGKKVDAVDTTCSTPQQLVLGEYFNHKVDKRKGGARLHWGQHFFMKGMFYLFQFADGAYTSSFHKDRLLDSHVDVSINFDEHYINSLLTQLADMGDVLCRPPVDENGVSELQDQYQLHIRVSANAVAEVSEFFANKKGEKDRLTIRIAPRDIVEFKIVSSSDDAFKASAGGTQVQLDVLMEGLFGKQGSVGSVTTVEEVRERFITSNGAKKRKQRKSRKSNSTSNDVVTETTKQENPKKEVILAEDEDDDDIPL